MLEFIIPIRIDFKDRENNLKTVIKHIKNKYDFLINVIECDKISKLKDDENYTRYFYKVDFDYYNRSYNINRLIDFSKCEFLCICDCDIIFDYIRFDKALKQIPNFDFIFPYNGPIYNININQYLKKDFSKKNIYSQTSNSGIFVCKRESFINSGMFNENFKGWGGEEEEFYYRINKLNFKIGRIPGVLYHLNHFRKDIFKTKNLIENNKTELEKIKRMNINEIKDYFLIKKKGLINVKN